MREGWYPQTISLTARERESIANLAAERLQDVGSLPADPTQQLNLAAQLAAEMEERSPRLAQALARLPYERNCEAQVVHGLPAGEDLAPLVQLATSMMVGQPFNYAEQNGGALSMRLEPRRDSAANTNTTPDEFALHSDDAVMPEDMRTTWISLYGIRNPRRTLTGYAPIEGISTDIGRRAWDVLRAPRFSVRVPLSFELGDDIWSEPRPILGEDDRDRATIAWPSYATKPADTADTEACNVLAALKQAMEQRVSYTALCPGTLLVFSNLHGAHKRTPIGDGSRLVLRNYIRADLAALREKAGHEGHIFSLRSLLNLDRGRAVL